MMTQSKAAGLITGLVLLLGGCSSLTDPKLVMDRAGAVDRSTNVGPAGVFIQREDAARRAGPVDAHQTSLLMLTAGMSLAQANCRGYFATAGQTQRNLIVARQVVDAVGALAVTLMLLDDVDPDSIALVELGQSTANSALDIWTRNYLFAAENISTVEELVIKAEDAYATEALTRTNLTYEKATGLVMGYQAICAPRRIAALVLLAVKAGNVDTAPTNSGAASQAALRDQEARRRLADAFGVPGELSEQQTGALWWLLMSYSTNATRSGQITTGLGSLASTILDKGEIKSGWTKTGEVRQAMMLFSVDAQTVLAKTATDAQKAEDDKAKAVKEAAEKALSDVQTRSPGRGLEASSNSSDTATHKLLPEQRARLVAVLDPNDRDRLDQLDGALTQNDIDVLMQAVPQSTSPVPPAVFVLPRPSGRDDGAIILNVH